MTDSLHHYFAKLLTLLPAPAPAHRPYTALDSVSVGARPLVALAFGVTRLGKLSEASCKEAKCLADNSFLPN